MTLKPIHCDIFCTVIDNFGDAAVCCRLARQLSTEYDWQIRLVIDRPEVLAQLVPDRTQDAVKIVAWTHDATLIGDEMPQVVIEAFACNPPVAYIEALATTPHPVAWLNLEYLSAESWVEGCHLKPSRHPRLPLEKLFYFPGFTPRTGGLLRERDYTARHLAFNPAEFRREFGLLNVYDDAPSGITISLFSYTNPRLEALMHAWAASPVPIHVLRPGTETRTEVSTEQRGSLTLSTFPFLPQQRYDELLWLCDINFVRGEDSFVRAQLAGKPLVWHIYPQDDDAHLKKLDAFLQRYPHGATMTPLWHAWNGALKNTDIGSAWADYQRQLADLNNAALQWKQELAAQPDLAAQLVKLCLERIE